MTWSHAQVVAIGCMLTISDGLAFAASADTWPQNGCARGIVLRMSRPYPIHFDQENMLKSNVVQVALKAQDYSEVSSLLERRALLLSQLQSERRPSGDVHPNSDEISKVDARLVEVLGWAVLNDLLPPI